MHPFIRHLLGFIAPREDAGFLSLSVISLQCRPDDGVGRTRSGCSAATANQTRNFYRGKLGKNIAKLIIYRSFNYMYHVS